jgi:squalene/oxidosqualene cyclase-like protein
MKSSTVRKGVADGTLRPIGVERLLKAVDILLCAQNEDGGCATYESLRGFRWYESLNPSEVFGDIMVDYSYVECTMAVMTALSQFDEMYPNYRSREISQAMKEGRRCIANLQRKDGSWYGSWAVCFCYASWFGIEGLVTCGEPLDSAVIGRACDFLIQHQRPNGGWGEDFTASYTKVYPPDGMKAYGDDGSGAVSTAWALMALAAAEYPDVEVIKRGVQFLLRRQLPHGDWPQEGFTGSGVGAFGLTYTAYRNVFPIWALGRCRHVYGDKLDR